MELTQIEPSLSNDNNYGLLWRFLLVPTKSDHLSFHTEEIEKAHSPFQTKSSQILSKIIPTTKTHLTRFNFENPRGYVHPHL